MFQILGILDGVVAGFTFSIISSLFSTVARVYDVLLRLVDAPNETFMIEFGNIVDGVYVAAGIFMLFRIMISMIQMFLNPDLVTDSQSGAGKLLSRIVISIALLILLQPTGFILGDTGMLQKIENAMIGPDGFISNLMEQVKHTSEADNNIENKTPFYLSYADLLVEDVYADTGDLSCYYLGIEKHIKSDTTVQTGQGPYPKEHLTINKIYKIDFFRSKDSADGVGTAYEIGNTGYYFKVRSGTTIGGVASYGKYSSLSPTSMTAGVFSNGFPSKCPEYLRLNSSGNSYSPRKDMPYGSIEACGDVNGQNSGGNDICNNTGILGGFESYSELKKEIDYLKFNYHRPAFNVIGKGDAVGLVGEGNLNDGYNSDGGSDEVVNGTYLSDVKDEAVEFAQTAAGTFMGCSSQYTAEECEKLKKGMFESAEVNSDIVNKLTSDEMTLDFFSGLLVGLALIAYLVILCVDVIVRRLKLLLLEMISPIPVISYIDPKDKMLFNWIKMYMSIYADLFIKLVALALLINLLAKDTLESFWGDEPSLLVKFLYIVAILVFAKVFPSLISKLFGLDNMGGSFKDILGMGKAAAGFDGRICYRERIRTF